jgi:hypothetical protein
VWLSSFTEKIIISFLIITQLDTMKYLGFIFVLNTFCFAQITIVSQTIDNGRIIIRYSLMGDQNDVYDITVNAKDVHNFSICNG